MMLSIERITHRAAVAALLLAMLWIPWTPCRILAAFSLIGVLPGFALVARSPMRRDAAIGIGSALSPVLFAAFVLLAMLAGANDHAASVLAACTGATMFVALGSRGASDEAADRRAFVGALCVLVVAGVLAFSLPLSDPWWRTREDSWFHAAVANKLARDGLPLTDPYFAGLRIQYSYAYHAIVSACAALTGIDAFRAMILVNAIALSSSVLAFYALVGQFARRTAARIFAVCLFVFGMNGWFYLSYPIRLARAIVGDTHGIETLRALFPVSPAGHATAVSLVSVEGNQFMFLDKFMIGTALSLTFGLTASLLYLLVRGRRGEWSTRYDVAFALTVAGSIMLHAVIGFTAALATAVVLAFLLVIRSEPSPRGPSYARLLGWMAIAIAATTPYLVSVSARGGGATSLGFAASGAQAIGVLFDVLPVLVLTFVFLRAATRDTPETCGSRMFAEMSLSATGIVALWTTIAAAAALFVDLVTNNETKFAFVVFIPLAALAGGGLDRMWESRRARLTAIAVVVSATLPLACVYFAHAFRDSSTFVVGDPERAVYEWIEKNTPRDAMVVDTNDVVAVPVLASRDVYWGTEGYARNWGYSIEEMRERKRVRDAIYSSNGPTDVDLLRVRSLNRPVFVIYRSQPDDMIDAGEKFENDRRFRGRFATRDIAVWELLDRE